MSLPENTTRKNNFIQNEIKNLAEFSDRVGRFFKLYFLGRVLIGRDLNMLLDTLKAVSSVGAKQIFSCVLPYTLSHTL